MATLKQIADQIALSLNRPFDDMLKERVKAIYKQELAVYIRQQINKHGIDSQFKTRYSITCKRVNIADSSLNDEIVGNCFRTINKVAKPVRYITDDPFTYVGSINGQIPFTFINTAALEYYKLLPAVQKAYQVDEEESLVTPPTYDYLNGYIYVYYVPNEIDEDEPLTSIDIMVEGVHSSYDFIQDESLDAKQAGITYLDTVDFPMPDDIIQLVKEKLLATELSLTDDKDKIISPHLDNN